MEIRVIVSINLFLLVGYTVGLSVIAAHSSRFRQFFWFAAATLCAAIGSLLRMPLWHLSAFLSMVVPNFLVVTALLIIHRRFALFVKAKADTRWLEATILAGTLASMVYYALIHPSFTARSVAMTVVFVVVAVLSASVLIRYADPAVRTACRATASLYFVFGSLLVIRAVWTMFRGGQQNFFQYSPAHLMGFLGVDVLIVGVPLGYFWMMSARLYADLELLARTDSLTNLLNRRSLKEAASREIDRRQMDGGPLTVLAVDIDHFKRINDRYGHDAGDKVLVETANALAEALRKQDVVARLGGEEFVVLLPDTDMDGAVQIAERLREIVEALVIECGPYSMRVTASFGIALLQEEDTFETVLQRADQALYAAKMAGRNYVMAEAVAVVCPVPSYEAS